MNLFVILVLVLVSGKCEAFNTLLLGRKSSETSLIAARFLIEMPLLLIIDLSEDKTISSEMFHDKKTTQTFQVHNDLNELNFGQQIDKSALSEYPTTLGIYLKGTSEETTKVVAKIAKFNPRSKLLIQLTDGNAAKAKKILLKSFHDHKMLDVAVITNHRIYLCNPFTGTKPAIFMNWSIININLNESIQSISKFTKNRVRNLHKHPLKIAIYEHLSSAMPIRTKKGKLVGYNLPDGDMIHQLSISLNFTPIYFHPGKDSKRGFQLENGTFTGSLGAVENGQADYSANSLLISFYNTSKVIFCNPMEVQQFLFAIEKREATTDLGFLIYANYDRTTRFFVVFLANAFPIYTIVSKLESKIHRAPKRAEFMRNFTYLLALQMNVSMLQPKRNASRMIIASVLFLALIMTSIFQGTTIASLCNSGKIKTIKTVDELIANNYKLVVSNYKKGVVDDLGERWKQIVANPKAIILNTLNNEQVRNISNVAFLTSKVSTDSFIKNPYDKKNSLSSYKAVPEVIHEFYLSPIMPKTSPFIEQFRDFMMKYKEFGFRQHQSSFVNYERDKYLIQDILAGRITKQRDQTIDLNDLLEFIQVYLMLNGVAFVIFVSEMLLHFVYKRFT